MNWIEATMLAISSVTALAAASCCMGLFEQSRNAGTWLWLSGCACMAAVLSSVIKMVMTDDFYLSILFMIPAALLFLRHALTLPASAAALGSVLSAVLWSLQLLAADGRAYVILMLAGVLIILCVIGAVRRRSLLPESYQLLPDAEDGDGLPYLPGYLWIMTGVLALMLVWILYLLFRMDRIAIGDRLAAAAFTLLALGVALALVRSGVLRLEEQNEERMVRQRQTELVNFMHIIRSQRHDYNFHVQTISGLIQAGNLEECRKYVHALEQDSAMMNDVLPVKDPAIAAMIHSFWLMAVREGIEMHISIQNDLSRIVTNAYETNKIISNLLQNALDETKTHQDKSYGIHLSVLKRGEYCIIRVSNELENREMTAEDLQKLYRQGYTTKLGHEGVGLSAIRLLAARYKGVIYNQIEGRVIHFIAKIPLGSV